MPAGLEEAEVSAVSVGDYLVGTLPGDGNAVAFFSFGVLGISVSGCGIVEKGKDLCLPSRPFCE
jgi:hypothetical protein